MEEVSSSVGRWVAGPLVVAHLEEVRLAVGRSVGDRPSWEAVHRMTEEASAGDHPALVGVLAFLASCSSVEEVRPAASEEDPLEEPSLVAVD